MITTKPAGGKPQDVSPPHQQTAGLGDSLLRNVKNNNVKDGCRVECIRGARVSDIHDDLTIVNTIVNTWSIVRAWSIVVDTKTANLAVSTSPRPWIDVGLFAIPEKFNMAVTESDLDPKVLEGKS